jgi:hypothetical protein
METEYGARDCYKANKPLANINITGFSPVHGGA